MPHSPKFLGIFTIAGLSAGFAWIATAAGIQQPAPVATPEQVKFFETKIRPVLVENCAACHGVNSQLAGFRVDSRAALVKGGDSGPSIQTTDPEKSLLLRVIKHIGPIKMPKGGKLAPAEIADLEAWVKMGAPWPAGPVAKTVEKAPLWSLQPVRSPAVPAVKMASWVKNPIDAFIVREIERASLTPASPADRRTLLRRVTYDLTGLPPTLDELAKFLADKSPEAYERVVDRLLASPHYGERWARQWLDVARYADTKGYVFEEDRNYPHAYTYRDWLINALNRDLPYDKFVKQQLAADLLPEVKNSDDKRPLAAMGFLTLGRRFLNQPPDIIDDRIDVTMRGLQGFTVACARCHDHKFDPIPTQDYYSLYAVFDSSQETLAPISERAIRDPWTQNNERLQAAEGAGRAIVEAQVKRLRELKNPANPLKEILQSFREGTFPNGDQMAKLMPFFEPGESDKVRRFTEQAESLKKNAPPVPEFGMAMVDSPNPHDGVVFKRGNPGNPGDPAPRRFLAALSKLKTERPTWREGSGRLQLAESIASKENPLTARVIVNRIWQGHFGSGIVRTPSDFGRQGEKPTHPELLDYLASRFMNDGWSLKRLHRLIVTSATYRQSSAAPTVKVTKDPDNRLLARFSRRRLDMEQMRDSILFATGKLNLGKVGGKSVDIWGAPFSARRSVYGFVERQNLPGIFRTFDFASPDSTNARRFMTTVPQQALYFLNSAFSVENARDLVATKPIQQAPDDALRVKRLYLQILGRSPEPDELTVSLNYLRPKGEITAPTGVWQYGYGTPQNFTRLQTFANGGYQVGSAFPDPKLGYITIRADGAHPGVGPERTVIRRWTAPENLIVDVIGTLGHGQKDGDGVEARLVSSRKGVIQRWRVHNRSTGTQVQKLSVVAGETLDFVIDSLASDSSDATSWAPVIRTTDGRTTWNSARDFGPPPPPPITRLVLLAQALLMTNEFLFLD